MPYGNSYYSRYRNRRRNYRRRFNRYRRNYMSRALARPINRKDGYPTKFKIRQQVGIEVPAGTSVGTFIQNWFSLTSPIYPYNSEENTYEDWTNIAQLYDYYRPTGIKIKFIPTFNVNQITGTPLNYILPVYVAHDYEDYDTIQAGMSDPDNMLEYENCKTYDMTKWFSHYVKVPAYTSVLDADLTNIPGLTKTGYIPTDRPGYNGILGMGFSAPFTTTGTPASIGTVVLTMYLKAYTRK